MTPAGGGFAGLPCMGQAYFHMWVGGLPVHLAWGKHISTCTFQVLYIQGRSKDSLRSQQLYYINSQEPTHSVYFYTPFVFCGSGLVSTLHVQSSLFCFLRPIHFVECRPQYISHSLIPHPSLHSPHFIPP